MITELDQSIHLLQIRDRWSYIRKLMDKEITFDNSLIKDKYLQSLDEELTNYVKTQHVTVKLKKRQNGIINHLSKVLTNKFDKSKLISFGGYEAGLNLLNEPIDLCLEFGGALPKKIISKITRILEEDGMDNVSMILTAKNPRVVFIDNKSRIVIDLSVDDKLANHRTKLLKNYLQIDKRVKPFIFVIKQWAQNRGIASPVEGTLSPYSWTLLGINFLQRIDPVVVPNLLTNSGTKTGEYDGSTFNVGISNASSTDFTSVNSLNIGQLFCRFIEDLAKNWPWENYVISVGKGKQVSRESKGWKQAKPTISEVITSNNSINLGRYAMPIEDPLDNKHDLGASLPAEGIIEIRNEVLRAYNLIHLSTPWQKLVEVKDPKLVPEQPKLDLFEDLRDKDNSVVKLELTQLNERLSDIEKAVAVRESERNEAIKLSKALRKNAELAREQSKLSSELRPRRAKLNELQSKRDVSNNNYIPIHFIEEEMARVYELLTEESSNQIQISFEKEKTIFSWFFELQSMYEHSKRTRKYHREFLRLLNQQENSVKEIKTIRNEMVKVENLGKPTYFDDLAKRLLKELNPLKRERRFLRREIGRLESWLRNKNNQPGRHQKKINPKTKQRGYKNSRINDVKNKVESGGSFSLQDLDILLKNGGFSTVNKKPITNRKNSKRKKNPSRGLSAHRGKRGKSPKRDS